MNKEIGAQFFTIREHCQTLEEFEKSCKKIADIGYKVIQLSGIGDFTAEEIQPILEKYHLTCACTHRGGARYLEHLEEEIAFHKALDCKVCGLGSMPAFNARKETVEDFVTTFGPVCERLAEEGLIFAYHNHAFEFEKRDGRYVLEELLAMMPYDNFKLILDVYWLAFAGIDPAEFIRKYHDKVVCIHFKDLKVAGGNQVTFAEVGCGNLDWDKIIRASMVSSAEYALVEQDECEGDPFEALRTSYVYLQKRML